MGAKASLRWKKGTRWSRLLRWLRKAANTSVSAGGGSKIASPATCIGDSGVSPYRKLASRADNLSMASSHLFPSANQRRSCASGLFSFPRNTRRFRFLDGLTMCGNCVDQSRNEAGRDIVTHSGDDRQFRSWNLRGRVPAGFDGYRRIVCTVQYKGWNGNPLKHFNARAVCQDRGELPADSRRIVGAVKSRTDLRS